MKKKAPVALTGGDGFLFEDLVSARFLLDILGARWPFGVASGRIRRLHWQARDTGWLLDDLVAEIVIGDEAAAVAMSIKQDKQVTARGLPKQFVRAAWQHFLGAGDVRGLGFQDVLVLVVGELASSVHEAWSQLLKAALSTTEERLLSRLEETSSTKGTQSSKIERKLFESIQCPTDLSADQEPDKVGHIATVKLLRQTRVLHFDLRSPTSHSQQKALLDAQDQLRSGDVEEARALWGALCNISSSRRAGGALDEAGVIEELQGRFQLRNHPDFRADWTVLRRRSQESLDSIRTAIADLPALDRQQEQTSLNEALASGPVLLWGESGAGKSALAKELASNRGQVVWLSPDDLAQGPAVAGLQHPIREVLGSARESVLVVVDSAEHLSARALQLVASLAPRGKEASRTIAFLLTATPDAVGRISNAFLEFGSGLSALIALRRPSSDQIARLVQDVAGLHWAALRPEVRPALRNLKVLEWVVDLVRRGAVVDESRIVNISDLIDHLWNRWVEGNVGEGTHAAILMRTATIEGDSLVSGASRTTLGFSEQSSMLEALMGKGLVSMRDGRVVFTHEMLGDWARLRVLISEVPDSIVELRARGARPRWQRAIRLYGQWLLDRSTGGSVRWKELLQLVSDGTEAGSIVRDLLLESVFLAPSARTYLEAVWPLLIAGEALLLKIGLERFLYAATSPDPQFLALLARHAKFEVRHLHRVPVKVYWGPILSALHAHCDDVVEFIPHLASRVVGLWLQTTPLRLESSKRRPWQDEAAALAFSIARKRQMQMVEYEDLADEDERAIFEALLHAAPTLPEEVTTLCLELCHRRPLSSEVEMIRAQAERRREEEHAKWERENVRKAEALKYMSMPVLPRGSMRAQWTDGPNERVCEAFCAACHDASAFAALVSANAFVASEVLLAVCIEEPDEEKPYGADIDDDLGMNDWRGGYPAMYFRGPFLRFFREAPEQALSFALCLVNFATERWCENAVKGARRHGYEEVQPPSIALDVAEVSRAWFGDETVYQWHYSSSLSNGAVHCTLMAFEYWLRELLHQKKDISSVLTRILSESSSLAFAGVLVDIGKEYPYLFTESLRPLLGPWELYLIDSRVVAPRAAGIWSEMISWGGKVELERTLAAEWYALPHRNQLLWDVATWLCLNSSDMKAYFSEVRESWTRLLQNERFQELRVLIERLNPHNYVLEELPGGKKVFTLRWPKEISERHRSAQVEADQSMEVMLLPWRCRRWLNGEEPFEAEQAPNVWAASTRIAAMLQEPVSSTEDEFADPADAVYGCIAVLLVHCWAWAEADPERYSWCRARLSESLERTPRGLDFGEGPFALERSFQAFAAEAGVAILAHDPSDELARRLVAWGVTAERSNIIAVTMTRAFFLREQLGEEFLRLGALALNGAGVLGVLRTGQRLRTDVQRCLVRVNEMREAFVGRNSDLKWPSLQDLDDEAAAAIDWLVADTTIERRGSRGRRPSSSLHARAIMAALTWLDLGSAKNAAERNSWQSLLEQVLSYALAGLARGDLAVHDYERASIPGDFDSWVLERVGEALPLLNAAQAEAMWHPVLELGAVQHYWVETFFRSWFATGARLTTSIDVFMSIWAAMIRFALEQPSWKARGSRDDDTGRIVCELLALRSPPQVFSEDPRWRDAFVIVQPMFESAASHWLEIPLVAEGLARFAVSPIGKTMVLSMMVLLADAVSKFKARTWSDRPALVETLVAVLRCAWSTQRLAITSDPKYREPFHRLLTVLAARGSPVAQSFRDEVIDSIGKA